MCVRVCVCNEKKERETDKKETDRFREAEGGDKLSSDPASNFLSNTYSRKCTCGALLLTLDTVWSTLMSFLQSLIHSYTVSI